jgi:hypothetical protein
MMGPRLWRWLKLLVMASLLLSATGAGAAAPLPPDLLDLTSIP